MKNKTRIFAILTCLIITVSLFYGCGSKDSATSSTSTANTSSDNSAATSESRTTAGKTAAVQSIEATGTAPVSDTAQEITEDEAKQIALNHAGINEADASFVRVHLDRDFFKSEYEVEFYSGNAEFDYDIDAVTGEIISYDYDAEYYGSNTSAPSGDNFISGEKAQEAALNHAGLAAQDVQFIKAEFDYDDGRAEYEVEFYYGTSEYSYTIDAVSGEVIEFEKDTD